MPTLRTDQTELINDSISLLGKHKKIVVQLSTGGGKTVIFSNICHRFINKIKGKNALILVHRQELLIQTANTIKEWYGIEPIIINAESPYSIMQPALITNNKHNVDSDNIGNINFGSDNVGDIYVGMIETVNNRIKLFQNFAQSIGLLVVDECHIGNFYKIYEYFEHSYINENINNHSYIVGFSATPISANKKKPLHSIFKEIICGKQTKELIALGNLVNCHTICPKDNISREAFIVKKGQQDYDDKQQGEVRIKYIHSTVNAYKSKALGKKTIIFNSSIEHSKAVCEAFIEAGFNCRHIDSENEEERIANMEWFINAPCEHAAILCNVGIATTGFDCPNIEVVMVNKATQSLTLWLQMAGRGGRTYTNKNKFTLIDLGSNTIELGEWQADRNWRALFFQRWNVNTGVAPMKICPNCDGVVHAAVRNCPLPLPQLELDLSGNVVPAASTEIICNHYFAPKIGEDKGDIELVDVSEKHAMQVSKYEIHERFLQKEIRNRIEHGHKDGAWQLWYYCCFYWIGKFKKTELNEYLNAIELTYSTNFAKTSIPKDKAEKIAKERWHDKKGSLVGEL